MRLRQVWLFSRILSGSISLELCDIKELRDRRLSSSFRLLMDQARSIGFSQLQMIKLEFLSSGSEMIYQRATERMRSGSLTINFPLGEYSKSVSFTFTFILVRKQIFQKLQYFLFRIFQFQTMVKKSVPLARKEYCRRKFSFIDFGN